VKWRDACIHVTVRLTEVSDYTKHLIDKLVLCGLILGMMVFMLHVMHDPDDQHMDVITWAMRSIDMLFGTLIGLVGGYALAKSRAEALTPPPQAPKPPEEGV